jgi:hypothetical protein
MIEHRAADPAAPCNLSGMHGLHFGVALIKPLQRRDCEELAVDAEAEERNGRIEETINVECMGILERAVRARERKVSLQKRANITGSGVVNRDLTLSHLEGIYKCPGREQQANAASSPMP